LFLHD
jgi:hypothetical protein